MDSFIETTARMLSNAYTRPSKHNEIHTRTCYRHTHTRKHIYSARSLSLSHSIRHFRTVGLCMTIHRSTNLHTQPKEFNMSSSLWVNLFLCMDMSPCPIVRADIYNRTIDLCATLPFCQHQSTGKSATNITKLTTINRWLRLASQTENKSDPYPIVGLCVRPPWMCSDRKRREALQFRLYCVWLAHRESGIYIVLVHNLLGASQFCFFFLYPIQLFSHIVVASVCDDLLYTR